MTVQAEEFCSNKGRVRWLEAISQFSPESMCAEMPMFRMYFRSNSDVTSVGDDSNELVDRAL